MSDKQCILVSEIPAIGPYSQAVRAGNLLFVSGQPGQDPATKAAAPQFPAQARHAFLNLKTVLEAGGSGMAQVVNTTVLLTDLSNFAAVNDLFAEFFGNQPPARMTMQVPLPNGLLFSIGCVATV